MNNGHAFFFFFFFFFANSSRLSILFPFATQIGRRRCRGLTSTLSVSCPSLNNSVLGNNNDADWLNSALIDWDSPTPPNATQYWGILFSLFFFITVININAATVHFIYGYISWCYYIVGIFNMVTGNLY